MPESTPVEELDRQKRAAGTYVESFWVGAYWGQRPGSPEAIASRLLQTVHELERLDKVFQDWHVIEPPGAMPTEVTELASVVRAGVHRFDSDGSVIQDLGWQVTMFSGGTARNDPGADLSVHAGSTATRVGNNVVLSPRTVAEHEVFMRLAAKLVSLLVVAWEPDWAVFTSYTIHDEVKTAKRYPSAVSWFADDLGQLPNDLGQVRTERIAGGTLIDLMRDGELPSTGDVVGLRDRLAPTGILGDPRR